MMFPENLLIAALPSDEILAAYCQMFKQPKNWAVMIVTVGDKSKSENHPHLNFALPVMRQSESLAVLGGIGVNKITFLGYYEDEFLAIVKNWTNYPRIMDEFGVIDMYRRIFVPHPKEGCEVRRAVSDMVGRTYSFLDDKGPELYYYYLDPEVGKTLPEPDIEDRIVGAVKEQIISYIFSQDHHLPSLINHPYFNSEKFWIA